MLDRVFLMVGPAAPAAPAVILVAIVIFRQLALTQHEPRDLVKHDLRHLCRLFLPELLIEFTLLFDALLLRAGALITLLLLQIHRNHY